tara:strand:- start:317 stop:1021 length:705 start_codon:yes stop_codon:yes gene_type:complete
MKKIYYAPFMEGYQFGWEHPLFEEEVYIPIQPYLTYYKKYHEKHTYWKCPAWKHYWKNSFVIFSQMDMTITYDKDTGVVDQWSYDFINVDEGKSPPTLMKPPTPYNGVLVGQMHQHFVFWSKEKTRDTWVEIVSPPSFAEKGIEIISAEYPFNRWPRMILSACRFNNEVTNISRGEPIGVIRFRSYDTTFSLERKDAPDKLRVKSHNLARVKNFLPNKSWEIIKENKCPMRKFW